MKSCPAAKIENQLNQRYSLPHNVTHVWSHHHVQNMPRPSQHVAPKEPHMIPLSVTKTEREKGDNSFHGTMNALLLSRADIEKMLQAFPKLSTKRRSPWEIFYSRDAKFCTRLTHRHTDKLVFMKEASLSYISVSSCIIFIFSGMILFLKDWIFENKS